jgi:hypothetical protein
MNLITRKQLNVIADLQWERDPDSADGYVASIIAKEKIDLERKFSAAGFEVSTSKDIDGQHFIWVRNKVMDIG